MIVEFFNRGTGGGSGSVDYLLGKDRDRESAKLLRGNDQETIDLIDGLDFAKRYTSGCLSFEEEDLKEDLKRQLMDEFEEALFPGMDKNQYSCMWVEHRDKGRLELNFVIPNVELTTGKRLQPYYVGADFHRIDAWKQIKNIEHGFADPDDPERARATKEVKDLPRVAKEAQEIINKTLESEVLRGELKNRAEVIERLEAVGFEVVRQTKQSVSIKNPNGGRNIRLKGAIYEQDFRFSEELSTELRARGEDYRESSTRRLGEARERYHYGIEKRREYLAERYGSADRAKEEGNRSLNTAEDRGLRRIAEESRKLVNSIFERYNGENISTTRRYTGSFREERQIYDKSDVQDMVDSISAAWVSSGYFVGSDGGSGADDYQAKGRNSETESEQDKLIGVGRNYRELYDRREPEEAMYRCRQGLQREILGAGQEFNDIGEEVEPSEDRDTAVIVRCVREFNERVSKARERSDRARESTNERIRAVTEQSIRERKESLQLAASFRAEGKRLGITRNAIEFADRAKQEVERTVEKISGFIQGIRDGVFLLRERKEPKVIHGCLNVSEREGLAISLENEQKDIVRHAERESQVRISIRNKSGLNDDCDMDI